MKKLTIIIVSFNSFEIIKKCLGDYISTCQHEIIIVDNASTDETGEKLINHYKNIKLIKSDKNVGYGRAANIALRQTKTPFALLLNPDIFVTSLEIDKFLDEAYKSPANTAIWGPSTTKTNNNKSKNTDWISGCAMLFDVKKIIDVGLFDENIFLFYEETDLCYRTIKHGYKIIFCGNVRFNHLIGQATEKNKSIEILKNWHFGWSQSYYYKKHKINIGKKNTTRRFLKYFFKSIISIKLEKRISYKYKAYGSLAFIRGEKAFDENGKPKLSRI